MAEIMNETPTSQLTLGKVVNAAIRHSVRSYFSPITFVSHLSQQLYQWVAFKAEYLKQKNQKYYFLKELRDIEELLYELSLRQAGAKANGILIVAGHTASARKQIAYRLIKRYLQQRRLHLSGTPHLVTFEDPIENYFYSPLQESFTKDETHERSANQQPIDYTPRKKRQDIKSLQQAIENALQKTPAVLFVGETRNTADWEKLMHFAAGVDHLVVTTMDANSLTEAMSAILQITKAQDPRARSVIADRLLALICLRHVEINDSTILIPALWRRTPSSTTALIGEGLASLSPNSPNPHDNQPELSTVGYHWFAQRLLERAGRKDRTVAEEIERRARQWDLEGV